MIISREWNSEWLYFFSFCLFISKNFPSTNVIYLYKGKILKKRHFWARISRLDNTSGMGKEKGNCQKGLGIMLVLDTPRMQRGSTAWAERSGRRSQVKAGHTELEVEMSDRKLEMWFWSMRVSQLLRQPCSEEGLASPVRRLLMASESPWGREGRSAVG